MTGLEAAIRNALARAGDEDPQARERVYRSARAAFEKSIAQHEADRAIEPEAASLQRRRFEDLVRSIEAGYAPAGGTAGREAERPLTPADFLALVPERVDAPSGRTPAAQAPRIETEASGRLATPTVETGRPAGTGPAAEPAPSAIPTPRVTAERAGTTPAFASRDAGTPAPVVAPDRGVATSSPAGASRRSEPVLDTPVGTSVGTPGFAPVAESELGSIGRAESLAADAAAPTDAPEIASKKPSRRERRRAEKDERRRRRRGSAFAAFLGFVILVAAAGGALYWAAENGVLEDMARNVANRAASSGGPSGPRLTADDEFSGNWLSAFEPSAAADIKGGDAASIETVDVEHGAAARIASKSGRADGEVRIPVSAEILSALAGKRSTVALTLQATGNADTQIYVECSFGSLGTCGRRRFVAQNQLGNLIFDVDFTNAQADGNSGSLVLNADIFGKGGSVDLFAVRILPGG